MKYLGILITVLAVTMLVSGVAMAQSDSDTVSIGVTIGATVSISITESAPWTTSLSLSGVDQTAGANWTANNDAASTVAVDFDVAVTNGGGTWSRGDIQAAETFAMNISIDGGDVGGTWNLVQGGGTTFSAASINPSSSQGFDLQFLAPTATVAGGVQQTVTLTVTGTAS